ncbi:MAG: hypothetical protein ACQESC_02515 [Nanobdellota archaeon]
MCEYHCKGLCFHPDKISENQLAVKCDVHSCESCTNTSWQQKMIRVEQKNISILLHLARTALHESTPSDN